MATNTWNIGNGDYIHPKNARFIHVFLTRHVDGSVREMSGFTQNDAIKWTKSDDDIELNSDMVAHPLVLENNSTKGQVTVSADSGAKTNDMMLALYNFQKHYKVGQNPLIGIKIVNDNNGEVVNLPYALITKASDGAFGNGFDSREWTVTGWDYSDENPDIDVNSL